MLDAQCADVANLIKKENSLKPSKLQAFRLIKEQSIESLVDWVSMAQLLHPSLTVQGALQSRGQRY